MQYCCQQPYCTQEMKVSLIRQTIIVSTSAWLIDLSDCKIVFVAKYIIKEYCNFTLKKGNNSFFKCFPFENDLKK